MNNSESKVTKLITVKNIMRVLSLCCIAFVFCPTFLVSCSGQNIEVSVMTAVGGLSSYGETIVEPKPIMLICLLIPITMLVFLFLKKFAEKINAIVIGVCGIVDTVIWLIFRSVVKKMAEENYCTFKSTAWFVINLIFLEIIVILSALVILKKVQMEEELIARISNKELQDKINQVGSAVATVSGQITEMAGNVASNVKNKMDKKEYIGYCAKCGTGIEYGTRFCSDCGTPVPESMIAEAEEKRRIAEEQARLEEERRRAEEQAKLEEEKKRAEEQANQVATNARNEESVKTEKSLFCPACGNKLKEDAVFCDKCGKRVVD